METYYTPLENQVIELMRQKLSQKFGVTIVDNYVTLRFNNGEDLCQVTMKIDNVDTGETETCYLCNYSFNPNNMYDAKVSIETCAGTNTENVKLCYDCYCPK